MELATFCGCCTLQIEFNPKRVFTHTFSTCLNKYKCKWAVCVCVCVGEEGRGVRPFAVMLKMTSGKKRFAHALHGGMPRGEQDVGSCSSRFLLKVVGLGA